MWNGEKQTAIFLNNCTEHASKDTKFLPSFLRGYFRVSKEVPQVLSQALSRMSPFQYLGRGAMSGFAASRVLKALLVVMISYELYIKFIMEINTEITQEWKSSSHSYYSPKLPEVQSKKQTTTWQNKCFCLYQFGLLLNSQFGFPVMNKEKKSAMLIRNRILRLHSVHTKRYPHRHRSPISPVGQRKQGNAISSLH